MRQYAGFGTAAESNRATSSCSPRDRRACRWRSTCRRRWGATPTTRWRAGEVGRAGVAISSIDDMHALLDGSAARRRLDVDDHQRHGGDAALPLRGRRRRARHRARQALGHHPERHPQGVHRARHVHLPAGGLDAPLRRHASPSAARAAALEHDQHQRLPHPRGRAATPCRRSPSRSPTASPTSRRRARPGLAVDALRAAAVVLLQRPRAPARGGGQVPGRAAALGAPHARPLRRAGIRARRCCASTRRPPARR